METREIKNKITEYIIDTAYISPEEIKDDSLIFEEGLLDSMGFIMLISFIEETFEIKAKDSELLENNFQSVDAIAGFVEEKLAAN